ncbi:MFS transporter [Nocardioides carbamazepini]|uniref:MFS transporter n=1 Tax=Nocardioides carbamazepini TaxID=2854259 RepID=UPI002149EA14|nr:MFS transporter [Nocardioides carbamazepini]MCR1783893.1 MFS transporter [Nocardioides carbamazepini]
MSDRPAPRPGLVLGICCLSLVMVGIDITGLNLALPSIERDLHATYTQLQWVIDAYTVVLASLLMLAGALADRFGRRRVLQAGLVTFAVGSLLCSVAPSVEVLIAARVLQAVGGAMLNPVAMSIITTTYTSPRERARAIGVWGSMAGLSMALGPVVGGVLVDAVGWRAIFWVNLPVAAAALVLTAMFVPESRAERPRRFDPVGQVLVAVMLSALTFGIIEGRGLGWGSAVVTGCLAAAAVSCVALVRYELRRDQPLIDPRLFRSVPFAGAVLLAVLGFAAFGGFLFLNSLYLQDVRGLSPLHAGLMTLPMAAMIAIASPLSGRVVGARGPRIPLLVAGTGLALSALVLLTVHEDTSYAILVLAYVALGTGFGAINAPITNTAVSGMPQEQAGVAAAVATTSRQVGTTLGVAVIGAVALGHLDGHLDGRLGGRTGGPPGAELAAATHAGWLVMLCCGLGVLVVGLVCTRPRALRASGATGPARLSSESP